jgi:hypothetical protein
VKLKNTKRTTGRRPERLLERLYAYRKEAPVRLRTHKYAYARLRKKRFFVKGECQKQRLGFKTVKTARICSDLLASQRKVFSAGHGGALGNWPKPKKAG